MTSFCSSRRVLQFLKDRFDPTYRCELSRVIMECRKHRFGSTAFCPQIPHKPFFSRRNAHFRWRETGRLVNSSLILLAKGMAMTMVVFAALTASSIFAAATPTPAPVIMPTGTVRFTWSAPQVVAGVPAPVSYDFLESVGGTWRVLGNTPASTPHFDVKLIGTKPRMFGVRSRVATCPTCVGVITTIGFPGIVAGAKAYMETTVK